LFELAKILEKHEIFIISDEIYEKLIYDDIEYYSIAEYSDAIKNRTIIVNGLSKSFSMTGWRIGYTASSVELAAAMTNIQSHSTSNANSIAQYASVAAFSTEGREFLKEFTATFNKRRNLLVSLLDNLPLVSYIKPQGAFYVMLNVEKLFNKTIYGKTVTTASDVSELLVEKASVVTIPCESFGTSTFIRLSYAISEEQIRKGVERIREFLQGIK